MEGMNTNIMDINRILDEARNLGCSDLHFTAGLPPVVRLHGSIRKLSGYPDCTEPIIVNIINQITSIKHKSQISKGLDTDFSYVSTAGFRHRVNVYRQRGYHAVAIRLLRNDIPTLADLSLPATLGEFAMAPRGLVLVTGPTGSGKSTTLAAMIDHINRSKNCHIITVEDPIEYLHTHKQSMVNQREIGQDVDSFAGSLRAALREDPDVILVGEMRDFETINAAVTAAETGHLVFSTLHTTGAAETIDRIIDVYPPHSQGQIRSQLANSVVGIISQTLVPTADGKGRCAALEILAATDAIRSMIREGKIFQIPTAIATGKKNGMFTLDQDLARLVNMGKITNEVALRTSTEDTLQLFDGDDMKRTAKAASKKGFTLIELVVVVAIIGVLAGLLVPTMFDAVTNSRIASAQQTAKVIRDRSAEFFTKMDTQMHTYVGEVQKVVITVDNGTWSMTGGSAADWVDGVNHWNTLPGVSDPGNDPRQNTELLSSLAVSAQSIGTAYIEMYVEYAHVVGVTVIEGASAPAGTMPAAQDFADRTFGYGGGDRAGRMQDGTIIGTSPILALVADDN